MIVINSRQDLLEVLNQEEKIVMVERKQVSKVMTRFIKSQGFDGKLLEIVRLNYLKKDKVVLGKPYRQLTNKTVRYDAAYLVVSQRDGAHEEVIELLENLAVEKIICIDYEVYAQISQDENVSMDFMCVGFTKCGTTSLSAALRKNKKIMMPKGKETFYMHWRHKYDNSPEKFKKKYFEKIPENKLIGNIEPSYHISAKDIYECFGKDVKLIFMVRNPVGATFSYYKMLMRRPRREIYVNYYKKYGKYSVDIFSQFIIDQILTGKVDRFCYIKWIEEYLEYFPKENIKIVVFEELIKNTEQVMDEIQDFIGVKNKITYQELPHNNEGSGVSKNYASAYINYRYYHSIRNYKENTELNLKKKVFYNLAKKLQKHTIIENNEKMKNSQRDTLIDFYEESVGQLEAFMGRSLREVWDLKKKSEE